MSEAGVRLRGEVDAPPEVVFALLANLESDPRWRREWVAARPSSEGPPTVGSTTVLVGRALGRRFEVEYEVTDLQPDRTVAWRTLSGPLPLRFTRSVERLDQGSRVTFTYEVTEPSRLLRLVGPLVRRMGRRQLEDDLPRLRELLAAAPRSAGSGLPGREAL